MGETGDGRCRNFNALERATELKRLPAPGAAAAADPCDPSLRGQMENAAAERLQRPSKQRAAGRRRNPPAILSILSTSTPQTVSWLPLCDASNTHHVNCRPNNTS